MLQRRTDLAIEAKGLWESSTQGKTQLKGVIATDQIREGFPVTTVEILDQEGATALGKPIGRYITLSLEGYLRREEHSFSKAVQALAAEITLLLPSGLGDSILVVGLGNGAITPDAIGPRATESTLITRHLVTQAPEHFRHFRPVSALATGVLGTTGVESGELVSALVEKIQPHCVVAVDALASRSLDRLCSTIQLSNTGISPGSGIGNGRPPLNEATLGIPVLAIGVPTVVDIATLTLDVLEEVGQGHIDPAVLAGVDNNLLVTPKDIDTQVADMAKVIGYGLTLALQPQLTMDDLELFLS